MPVPRGCSSETLPVVCFRMPTMTAQTPDCTFRAGVNRSMRPPAGHNSRRTHIAMLVRVVQVCGVQPPHGPGRGPGRHQLHFGITAWPHRRGPHPPAPPATKRGGAGEGDTGVPCQYRMFVACDCVATTSRPALLTLTNLVREPQVSWCTRHLG